MIVGGFKEDTDRSEIEETLRDIVQGYEGVGRVSGLGKFGS